MKNEREKTEEENAEIEETLEQAKEIKDEIEKLQQSVEDFDSKYKRALADYQNLQKRVSEERVELIRSANKDLLLRILPVLDTLILASQHVEDQGLQVSINQFLDILKSEGVTRIKTEGVEFNPHTMECVMVEEGEENKVIEEVRAGYMLNEKVLRPAQVKVGKKTIRR
jgi:molecular chaperone GrpE